jgi:hypothetical protein
MLIEMPQIVAMCADAVMACTMRKGAARRQGGNA